jgi:hypothetical protein
MKPTITLPNDLDPKTRTYDPDDLTSDALPPQPNTPESHAAARQVAEAAGAHRSGDRPSLEDDGL